MDWVNTYIITFIYAQNDTLAIKKVFGYTSVLLCSLLKIKAPDRSGAFYVSYRNTSLAAAQEFLESCVQVLVAGPLPVAPGMQCKGVVVIEEGYSRDEQRDGKQGGYGV